MMATKSIDAIIARQNLEKKIVETAVEWRKIWVDDESVWASQKDCTCELCQLIRAVDQYLEVIDGKTK